jgi:hypothetical protein
VFDGATPQLKRATVVSRRRRKTDAESSVTRTAEKLLMAQMKLKVMENFAGGSNAQQVKKRTRRVSSSSGDGGGAGASSLKKAKRADGVASITVDEGEEFGSSSGDEADWEDAGGGTQVDTVGSIIPKDAVYMDDTVVTIAKSQMKGGKNKKNATPSAAPSDNTASLQRVQSGTNGESLKAGTTYLSPEKPASIAAKRKRDEFDLPAIDEIRYVCHGSMHPRPILYLLIVSVTFFLELSAQPLNSHTIHVSRTKMNSGTSSPPTDTKLTSTP